MTPSPTLTMATRGDLCSGCGLCAGIAGHAVNMAVSPRGYLRPVQVDTLDPAEEQGIAAACPAVIVDESHSAPNDDPLWGPWHSIGTGYATDTALRHQASSGGVISAILAHALKTGLVDFIVQTKADPNFPLANVTTTSCDSQQIMHAAGSRYTASAPLAELERWLTSPGKFAFVGKPCDISALRARARLDQRIDAKVPLMLSFFCAGIPSAAGTRRILDKLGVAEANVAKFRYRGDGWPGYATATLHDGNTARMTYADSWGDILSKQVQFRCKICPDAVGGDADLVAADAWYGDERGYPSFEEQDGRSLVIARTATGQSILDAAVAAAAVQARPLAITEIVRMQPSQARRKRQILSRLAALTIARRPVPRYRGVGVVRAARQESLAGQARSFGGLLLRLLKARRSSDL